MKTITAKYNVGYTITKLVSYVEEGQILDTAVYVNEELLVTVAGERRNEFIVKLRELIDEYRI